jgi:hypothetical protein
MDLIEGVRNEVLKGSIGTKGSLGKGPGKGWDCEKHSSQCATCAKSRRKKSFTGTPRSVCGRKRRHSLFRQAKIRSSGTI